MNAIATKTCSACSKNKPLDEFYRLARSPDGRRARCKACDASYDRSRLHDPKRMAQRKAYQQTDAYKDRHAFIAADWKTRHRVKKHAHDMVRSALRKGTLVRPLECEGCGPAYVGKLEAHHDDYTKPLDVKWLCDKCHKARHVELRLEATAHQDKTWNINAELGYHSTLPHESIPEEVAANDDSEIDMDTPVQTGGACPF